MTKNDSLEKRAAKATRLIINEFESFGEDGFRENDVSTLYNVLYAVVETFYRKKAFKDQSNKIAIDLSSNSNSESQVDIFVRVMLEQNERMNSGVPSTPQAFLVNANKVEHKEATSTTRYRGKGNEDFLAPVDPDFSLYAKYRTQQPSKITLADSPKPGTRKDSHLHPVIKYLISTGHEYSDGGELRDMRYYRDIAVKGSRFDD